MASRVILAFAVVLTTASVVHAQANKKKGEDSATRSVQGVVTDAEDKPLEGAVVQLKDTKTLQVRSFITRADGTYHFHGLSTNVDYQVKAEQGGHSSAWKTLSVFDNRKVAIINFKLEKKQNP